MEKQRINRDYSQIIHPEFLLTHFLHFSKFWKAKYDVTQCFSSCVQSEFMLLPTTSKETPVAPAASNSCSPAVTVLAEGACTGCNTRAISSWKQMSEK